ncbi:MAG: hypothetical protein Q8O19_00665, partial [Rectinemataceae bacterium]|nr:hypothetical protein [Rectinemataceae bacterium]
GKKPEKEKTEEERKRTARVYRNASLVLSQGKRDNVSSYMLTATFRAPEGAQDCRPTSCTKDARRWIRAMTEPSGWRAWGGWARIHKMADLAEGARGLERWFLSGAVVDAGWLPRGISAPGD